MNMSGMTEYRILSNGLSNAGVQGQSVFQSFGNTLQRTSQHITAANLLTDAIYKVERPLRKEA